MDVQWLPFSKPKRKIPAKAVAGGNDEGCADISHLSCCVCLCSDPRQLTDVGSAAEPTKLQPRTGQSPVAHRRHGHSSRGLRIDVVATDSRCIRQLHKWYVEGDCVTTCWIRASLFRFGGVARWSGPRGGRRIQLYRWKLPTRLDKSRCDL